MSKARILDPAASYTFSKYAELAYDSADILAELGVTLKSISLQLPQQLPINPQPLRRELEENLTLGDTWKFGIFYRQEKMIFKDINTYAVPSDLDLVLAILFGISLS